MSSGSLWKSFGFKIEGLACRNESPSTKITKCPGTTDEVKFDKSAFKVEGNEPLLTHIITDTAQTEPDVETIATQNGRVTIQLGYEPIILESAHARDRGGTRPFKLRGGHTRRWRLASAR